MIASLAYDADATGVIPYFISQLNRRGQWTSDGHQKKLSGILLRAFQSRHCFGEDLFRR
jgi:hypothetical protein